MGLLFFVVNLFIAVLGGIALKKTTDKRVKNLITAIVILSFATLLAYFVGRGWYYLNH